MDKNYKKIWDNGNAITFITPERYVDISPEDYFADNWSFWSKEKSFNSNFKTREEVEDWLKNNKNFTTFEKYDGIGWSKTLSSGELENEITDFWDFDELDLKEFMITTFSLQNGKLTKDQFWQIGYEEQDIWQLCDFAITDEVDEISTELFEKLREKIFSSKEFFIETLQNDISLL